MIARQSRFAISLFVLAAGLCCCPIVPGWAENPDSVAPKSVTLPDASTKSIDFVKDIQPLFAKHCYQCHGPDKQQAGLRLDLKQAATAGGDSGRSFEPGQSAKSLLVLNIAGVDPDAVMPPKGERLSAAEVGLIRAWIDQGAVWPDDAPGNVARKSDHWSFQPLKVDSILPAIEMSCVRNPIDSFILAKLKAEGITPAPEADRPTLIRRLSLDLLGLIPQPSEVEAFVTDPGPRAYEELVERLLSSPHFGERWGRHWLDLARYADSDGYEKDKARPYAYRYRDWVIDAINRDLPFDQFTIEQLAGDLLPDATLEQRLATGFHRNTLTNTEGGADQEEFRVAATVDRVNTLGSVWLGMTVGCAQCHSHKYDPFSQREYYQLFAFFNSIQEVNLPAPAPDEAKGYAQVRAQFDLEHAPFLESIQKFERNELPERQIAWEKSLTGTSGHEWKVLPLHLVQSRNGATLTEEPDGSWLASCTNPETDVYTIQVKTPLKGVTGIRLEVLPDARLPSNGPGRVAHGNFVLSEFSIAIRDTADTATGRLVGLRNAKADFEQGATVKKAQFPIENALDGKSDTGWAVGNQFGVRHVAIFECDAPWDLTESQTLVIQMEQAHGTRHTIGKFRLAVTTETPPLRLESMPDSVIAALGILPVERTLDQKQAVAAYYRTIDPELAKLIMLESEHLKKRPAEPATQGQMVQELATPRATAILIRGDFLRKGDRVQAGTPGVLPSVQFDPNKANRLDLARWLMNPEQNPLTPRVTVNLWWQYLFGRGLVATVEDFGVRGEPPSHPELLDWLALQLIEKKWSRKQLIHLIVNSATYRQSSRPRPELDERDPKNIWLSHQNRFRLEAEVVRDLYLAAGGILNRKVGGPSIRPPLPPGIAELGYAGSVKWPESQGEDKYRRGLYIFFQRTVPYPMLMAFDTPDSNSSCVRRERSNTPLQALTLLNDPVFFECAQSMGRRAVRDVPSNSEGTHREQRIRHMVQLCLGRAPTDPELQRLKSVADELERLIMQQPETAEKLAGIKPLPGPALETAVAVALGRIILNLDEFVVRE